MKHRLSELDALRGIAAVLVVLFHFTMNKPEAQYGFKYGVTGVDLFFIISGFVIIMTLSKVATWKEFAINRIARLYPCYWTCVTFTLALMLTVKVLGIKTADVHEVSTPQPVNKVAVVTPAQQPPVVHISQAPENTCSTLPVKKAGIGGRGIIEYLANLTMVQYYFGIKDIDGPYWTLVVELLFYVFMAILFQLNLLKSIEAIGAGILACTLLHVTLIQHYAPAVFEGINRAIPLINHFPLFFSGILFYSMFTGKADVKKYALLIASFGIQLTLFHSGGKSRYFITLTEYAALLVLYYAVFFLFVYKKLGFIAVRPLLFLGTISYALYLVHDYVSVRIILPTLLKLTGHAFALSGVLTLVALIALATFLTYKIEIPARGYFKNKLEQWWLGKQPKAV